MKINEQVKKMTGETDENLISLLLVRAENQILTITNRENLTEPLERFLPEVALELYNKQGSEGEQSRSEGGVSVTYTEGLSKHLMDSLYRYRLARVAGYAFEEE